MSWPTLVYVACSIVVLIRALCIARVMSPRTCHTIRAGVILLAVGALAGVVGPLYDHAARTWPDVLLVAGVAVYVVADRRRAHEQTTYLRLRKLVHDLIGSRAP